MKYFFLEKFVFRTPYKSYKLLTELTTTLNYYKSKVFKEAVYLSAPNLYEELIKWENGKLNNEKEDGKLLQSLYKYYTRMQSRCTPYGLFAGCSIGNWSNETNIILDGFHRHTRLDMELLCSLSQSLSQTPILKYQLNFFPNNSLYPIGEQFRYVEYRYINNKRNHQITSIDNNPHLNKILQFNGNIFTRRRKLHGGLQSV